MKKVILNISTSFLVELLQLPIEAEIDGFEWNFHQPDLLKIRVRGVGWEVPEGGAIMNTIGTASHEKESGQITLDWGLPE